MLHELLISNQPKKPESIVPESARTMNLLQASEFGTIDECRALLVSGEDVNKACEDYPGRTPLILAARRGRYDVCKLFLKYGADVDAEDLIGGTAIEYASYDGHEEIVELFKSCAAKNVKLESCNNNELHEAARKGDVTFCSTAPKSLNVENDVGDYPIYIAARMGYTDCVIALINAGSDVNQMSKDVYESPLHVAAEYGNLETCRALLEKGADIEITDGDYHTPLLHAANARRLDVCRLLLEHGACKTGHPKGGNPLEYAEKGRYTEIVEAFSEYNDSRKI